MTSDVKYKLILVDDHPFFRDGVRVHLQSDSRFEIIGEFSETRQLLNSERNLRPDLIVLDINLPGMDGIVSCELLKKKYQHCKILALTQYANLDAELMKAPFDGYVVKDKSDVLIEAIHCVLGGKKYFQDSRPKYPTENTITDNKDMFLKIKKLTTREIEVMQYVARDYSNKEISNLLFLSEETIKTHRKHFIQKTGVKKRSEIERLLNEYGLNLRKDENP
jgi:DNA-binding NarL/FixJ family response regulator